MIRWFALAVLLACVVISGYYRRRARLDGETIARRREGTPWLAARAFGGLLVLASIIAHVLAPARMRWATFAAPGWVAWAGAVLGALTVPAVYWVFVSLGRNVSETVLTKQDHELVTAGPYRWIRHPLYTTGLALLFAIGAMVASWLVLLFAFVALLLIRLLVVPREERQLVLKFGEEYRAYMRRTGGLFPRVTRPRG